MSSGVPASGAKTPARAREAPSNGMATTSRPGEMGVNREGIRRIIHSRQTGVNKVKMGSSSNTGGGIGSSRDHRQNRPGKAKGAQFPCESTNLFPFLFFPLFPPPKPTPFPLNTPRSSTPPSCSRGMFTSSDRLNLSISRFFLDPFPLTLSSGLARTFGRAAFARPTPVARAFQPLRSNALPALSARFASSEAGQAGKVHQVIGAVVDGTCSTPWRMGDIAKIFFLGPNPSPTPSQSIPKRVPGRPLTCFSRFF